VLCEHLPDVPRVHLEDFRKRFRKVLAHRKRVSGWRLCWLRHGAVWAADFLHQEHTLEPDWNKLLVVRDVADAATHTLHPVAGEQTVPTCAELERLFVVHGAPLVLKVDNGPAFIAADLRALAERHGVVLLFSPARTPSYNALVETTMTSLRNILHEITCRASRPGVVSRLDLMAAYASLEMQRMAALTGEQQIGECSPSDDERARFQVAYQQALAQACAEAQVALEQLARLPHPRRSALERRATQRALRERGLLELQRCTYAPRRAASRTVVHRDSDMLSRLCQALEMSLQELLASIASSAGIEGENALADAVRGRYEGDGNRDQQGARRRKGTHPSCAGVAEQVASEPADNNDRGGGYVQ
jgi:hypothetical protein